MEEEAPETTRPEDDDEVSRRMEEGVALKAGIITCSPSRFSDWLF